jgi:phosphatidylglycerol lysyltransferase
MLVLLAGLITWSAVRRRYFELLDRNSALPSPSLTLLATFVSALDWAVASLVLYFLLPDANLTFVHILGAYLLAQVVGLLSQVPGGLGVFEGSFIFLIGEHCPPATLVSALVLYRVVYYVIPFCSAFLIFGGGALKQLRNENHQVPPVTP